LTAPSVAPLTEAVTVRIPMSPAPALSPNNRSKRGGSWQREAATRELREAAMLVASGHRAVRELEGWWLPDGIVHIHEHIIWPKSQRGDLPDPDGLATYCKPALDGIVDAGILTGDSAKHIASVTTSQEKGTERFGYTIVTITPVADAPGAT
jgi:hypothetical protein